MPTSFEDLDAEWPSGFLPPVLRSISNRSGGILSTFVLALEAWRRGLRVEVLSPRFQRFSVSDGEKAVDFTHALPTSETPAAALAVTRDKELTNRALRAHGVPVPDSIALPNTATKSEILNAIAPLRFPLVVKPTRGTKGRGVHVGLATQEEVLAAFEALQQGQQDDEILIETHQSGQDYRVLVFNGEVLGAAERIPANVVPDGKSTVAELVEARNRNRQLNPFLRTGLIKLDREINEVLTSQGLTVDSVPVIGAPVFLRRKANASAGGDVIDRTSFIPPKVAEAAIEAVAALPGLLIAGVDVIHQPAKGAIPEQCAIIEINNRPHIGVNMYPSYGKGQDVPKTVMDYFFPGAPRPSHNRIEKLTFDVDSVTAPIHSGVASGVTLLPLPNHGFPRRRVVTYADVTALTTRIETFLSATAIKNGISGFVEVRNGALRVMYAGSRRNAAIFQAEVDKYLRTTPSSSSGWIGSVTLGFHSRYP